MRIQPEDWTCVFRKVRGCAAAGETSKGGRGHAGVLLVIVPAVAVTPLTRRDGVPLAKFELPAQIVGIRWR